MEDDLTQFRRVVPVTDQVIAIFYPEEFVRGVLEKNRYLKYDNVYVLFVSPSIGGLGAVKEYTDYFEGFAKVIAEVMSSDPNGLENLHDTMSEVKRRIRESGGSFFPLLFFTFMLNAVFDRCYGVATGIGTSPDGSMAHVILLFIDKSIANLTDAEIGGLVARIFSYASDEFSQISKYYNWIEG